MHKTCSLLLCILLCLVSTSVHAIVVYDEGGRRLEVGAYIQPQYLRLDPGNGESRDDTIFRRLRPYIIGTITENWIGRVQVDFGDALGENESAIKDAFMRYTGLKGFALTVGNQKPPFSREFLTSFRFQELAERSFPGDHNFGSPDRMLGIRIDGDLSNERLSYAASVGAASHDPDARLMDFDSPANDQEDWNEGVLVVGRLDFHPFGKLDYRQGDFHTPETKLTVSLAAFAWNNDGDNNTYTENERAANLRRPDLDQARGVEISSGVRGHGFSVDAEYHHVNGETVDPSFTGGLYRDGSTDLDTLALEGGYMVIPNRLEVVAGWEFFNTDTYESRWRRTSVGLNYFWNRYDLMVRASYRIGKSIFGARGDDLNSLFLQMQLLF